MTILFLDTYYVEGGNSDTTLTIIGVIVIPILIFFLTIWTGYYKDILHYYNFREGLFFKTNMLILQNQRDISFLEMQIQNTSVDTRQTTKFLIPTKNSQDILNLPFKDLVDAFRVELDGSDVFRNQFETFNNAVITLEDLQRNYETICDSFNDELITITNNTSEIHRNLIVKLQYKLLHVDLQYPSQYDNYISKVRQSLHEINSEMDFDEIVDKYDAVLRVIESEIPDIYEVDFANDVSKIQDNLKQIRSIVNEFKNQMRECVHTINANNIILTNFLPNIRSERPKNWQILRYFTDK